MEKLAIGQNIASLRKAKQWSQTVLAQKSGVSRAFVSNLERGTGSDPSLQKVINILSLFAHTLKIVPADAPPTLDDLLEQQQHD